MSEVPPPFERSYSFTDFSTYTPNLQHPGNKIDQELNNVRTSVNATIDRLSEIQRDDGYLDSTSLDFNEVFTELLPNLSLTFAALNSPVFTGSPEAPTPSTNDNSTKIATTEFVKLQDYATQNQLASLQSSLTGYLPLSGGTLTGQLQVSAAGLKNPLNENFVIDAYNDDGAGTHNYFKFNPFGGGLELPANSAGIKFGDDTIQTTAGFPLTGGTITDGTNTIGIIPENGEGGQIFFDSGSAVTSLDGYQLSFQDGTSSYRSDGANIAGGLSMSNAEVGPFSFEFGLDTGLIVNGSEYGLTYAGGGLTLNGTAASLTLDEYAMTFGFLNNTLGSGILFSDGTTQVTAALPLTGGTVTGNTTFGSGESPVDVNITGTFTVNNATTNFIGDGVQVTDESGATGLYAGFLEMNLADTATLSKLTHTQLRFEDGTTDITIDATGVKFPNQYFNSSLSRGSFDSGRSSYNGISLICTQGIELNWQAGYLKALSGSYVVPIYVEDSNINFVSSGEGVNGITFGDSSFQSTAGLPLTGGTVSGEVTISLGSPEDELQTFIVKNYNAGPYFFVSPSETYAQLGGVEFDGNETVFKDPANNNTMLTIGKLSSSQNIYGIRFNDSSIQTTAFTPANYAALAGATFTGKVNVNTGTGNVPLNLGITGTPASFTIGDVWIAGSDMRFRDSSGATKILISAANSNAFTTYQSITSNSNTNPALTVTATGTADAFKVEDSASPDATPFVINASGRVGIGVAPDATAALSVDSTGIKVNGMVIVPATTVTNSTHTSGNMHHEQYTKELIVTLGGVQYGIPLRVV